MKHPDRNLGISTVGKTGGLVVTWFVHDLNMSRAGLDHVVTLLSKAMADFGGLAHIRVRPVRSEPITEFIGSGPWSDLDERDKMIGGFIDGEERP